MKKIIVSSLYMRRKFKDADIDLAQDNDEFKVICKDKYLTIDRVLNMAVESRQGFEATVTGIRLKKLSRICGMIEDQPVVIEFDDFDRINMDIQL